MNGVNSKTEITELNIEEMSIFAEAVLGAVYMRCSDYDEEGNEILSKYYEKYKDYDTVLSLVREERMKISDCPNWNLLYNLFRRGDDIGDVRYYTLEDVRPWVEPLIPKVLGIFRKGIGMLDDNHYVVADSVSDEYLIALFAREVRNMMMIFAGQRLQAKNTSRYLLLLESEHGHDMDEWMGIYFDNKDLKEAYEELTYKLEKYKEVDKSYSSLHVAIWEFKPKLEYEKDTKEKDYIEPMQRFSLVNPKTLRCFRAD